MNRLLYVALPPARPVAGSAFDYVVSEDGLSALQQGRALMAQLPRTDGVCLLVPAQRISWHAVRVPPGSAARMPQVLAGLLEDRLLDDPAALAFALAPQAGADGTCTVAVLDKAWLRGALDCFEQQGRIVTRVAPLYAPAGDASVERRLVVHGAAEQAALVCVQPHAVLSLPLNMGPAALAVLDGGGALPLFADPALLAQAQAALGRDGQAQTLADAMLAAARSSWILAQFDLAISARARWMRRLSQGWGAFLRDARWRPVRWGALVVLLANVAGLNAWAWRLESSLQAKRDQARTTLLQAFPGVRTVVDAPLQMERELAALRRASGALARADLEAMLAAAGTVLPANVIKGATGIEFAGGELTLVGSGLAAAQWPTARDRLVQAGYSARLDGDRLQLRVGSNGP